MTSRFGFFLKKEKVYDLTDSMLFTHNQVTPNEGDISTAADVWRRMNEEFGAEDHDLFRQEMYTNAALTNWECCRLLYVRSCEVLVEGEIPFECVSVVHYTTHVQSVTNLPHQPHEIPFESFETSVAADRTRYADGDNGGLLDVTLLTDNNNQYLLKQARRNSLETGPLTSRELRSSIDLEFAAFDTYRRVANYVPGIDIAVRDCVKVTFRYEILGLPHAAELEDDRVLNCLLFRCLKQPTKLLPVVMLPIPLSVVKQGSKALFGDDFRIPDKPQATGLQVMQKRAKQAGKNISPDVIQRSEELNKSKYYISYHFQTEDCAHLFKGLAVDLLVGNICAGGCYEKAGVVRSSTGKLYRLSADRALGNQLAESLNVDRQDDHAGFLLFESISIAASSNHIPLRNVCLRLKVTMNLIKEAVKANEEAFYSDAYRRLDLPYDVKRSVFLYPELNQKAVEYDEEFKRTSCSGIWKDYLLNRCDYLCFMLDWLEEKCRNTDCENTAEAIEALYDLFNFTTSYLPFYRNWDR